MWIFRGLAVVQYSSSTKEPTARSWTDFPLLNECLTGSFFSATVDAPLEQGNVKKRLNEFVPRSSGHQNSSKISLLMLKPRRLPIILLPFVAPVSTSEFRYGKNVDLSRYVFHDALLEVVIIFQGESEFFTAVVCR